MSRSQNACFRPTSTIRCPMANPYYLLCRVFPRQFEKASDMTITDEIWIATCILHQDFPDEPDFAVNEIRRAVQTKFQDHRPGVQTNISVHCVANKVSNPGITRVLVETTRGRRRLFRPGDGFHHSRSRGRSLPLAAVIAQYDRLLDWYKEVYCKKKPLNPFARPELCLEADDRLFSN